MRYVVKWLKDGSLHQMLTGETTPGAAMQIAWALLEARPTDIWIETPTGRRVASYEDVVEEGPLLANALRISTAPELAAA
jgi:hypothetical protein